MGSEGFGLWGKVPGMNALVLLLLFPLSVFASEPGYVGQWLDGDTLVIDGKTICLANIDAPELDQPFGKEARRLATEWSDGRPLQAYWQGHDEASSKDKYGCWIADICEKGTWPPVCINDLLVEAGMAWVYTRYNQNPNLPQLEKWAKENRIGLWSDPNPVEPWRWRRGAR